MDSGSSPNLNSTAEVGDGILAAIESLTANLATTSTSRTVLAQSRLSITTAPLLTPNPSTETSPSTKSLPNITKKTSPKHPAPGKSTKPPLETTPASIAMPTTPKTLVKKRTLNADYHKRIADFVNEFKGLAIDCEIALLQKNFLDVDPLVLKGVVQTELGCRIHMQFDRYKSRAKKYLRTYEKQSEKSDDKNLLLNLARRKGLGPVMLCRLVLHAKYGISSKKHLTQLVESTELIEDTQLAGNVKCCIAMDVLDGPAAETRWRTINDNYRGRFLYLYMRLRHLPNFHFVVVNETNNPYAPDFMMRNTFVYKDATIAWVQSVAGFGDVDMHKMLLKAKFRDFSNRYGPGMVIYWFGYHDDVMINPDNLYCVSVAHDFPNAADIMFNNETVF